MSKVYNRIESIEGNVIAVKASGIRYGDLAQIETSFGTSLAEVIKMNGDLVYMQVFAGSRGVSTGDELRFLGKPMQVSFSDNLIGSIFNARETRATAVPACRTT